MDKMFGIMIFCTLILALSFVAPASAATWSVDASGDADFTGIQEAINNASAGDTILVYSGVYYEKVVVDKSVTLKGIGHPVVDARWGGSAVTLTAYGITLERFNVTHSYDAGIRVISNNNNITGNNVYTNGHGIWLYDSSNNTITGNTICNNNGDGIELWYSSNNNAIIKNNVSNNNYGIHFESSSNNTRTGNNVSNNRNGIDISSYSNNNTITDNTFVNDTFSIDSSYQNRVKENTVNGKPLVYLEDVSNYKVEDAGQIILVNCNNITVKNLDLSNTTTGIELWGTVNCTISNNKLCNNSVYGIRLSSSGNNTITGNNVSNNGNGIDLSSSSNNKIYFNNFINNTDNVDSSYSINIWNSPLEITYTYDGTTYKSYLGNYWDDYEGTDADEDGIGDTHYSIDSEKDESDDYPLMKPFENY